MEGPIQDLLKTFIKNKIVEKKPTNMPIHEFVDVVNPIFGVFKSDSVKVRFIIDLRYINNFMRKYNFKLETIKVIRRMIFKGDYFISVDLSKAYYHLAINQKHQKYLGFTINGEYYRMLALPMGASFSPFAFQMLAKQVLFYIRQNMKIPRSSVYLDDGIFMLQSLRIAEAKSKIIVQLYADLGFIINIPKSMTKPSRICIHLGFILDSMKMTVQDCRADGSLSPSHF